MPRTKMFSPAERYRALANHFLDNIMEDGRFVTGYFDPIRLPELSGYSLDSLFIELLENEDVVRSVLSDMGRKEIDGGVDQQINDLIDYMREELTPISTKYLKDYDNCKKALEDGDLGEMRVAVSIAVKNRSNLKGLWESESYKSLIEQLNKRIEYSEDVVSVDSDDDLSDDELFADVKGEREEPEPEPEPQQLDQSLSLSPLTDQGSLEGSLESLGSESGSDAGSETPLGWHDGPGPGYGVRSRKTAQERNQAMDASRGRPPTLGFGERLLKCFDRGNCAQMKSGTKKKPRPTQKKPRPTQKKKKPKPTQKKPRPTQKKPRPTKKKPRPTKKKPKPTQKKPRRTRRR